MVPKIAPSFNSIVYRSSNSDLGHLTDDELLNHYENYGLIEGRIASDIIGRESFVKQISAEKRILEIGPFDSPCIVNGDVEYLDLLSQKDLKTRAAEINRNPENVPNIRWVARDGTLDIVTEKYDVLFSSHNIEHQVDLVKHLSQASKILNEDGLYFLIIPDSRYCFDHYLKPSTISHVLSAYAEQRTFHTVQSVIEHRIFTTHNDPVRHWAGDHGEISYSIDNVKAAINEYKNADGILDVHAWQFTPETFAEIINELTRLELISFEIVQVYPTLRNEFEFKVVLRKLF